MDRAEISELMRQVDANAGSVAFLARLRDTLAVQGHFKEAIAIGKRMLLCYAPENRRDRSCAWMSLAVLYCSTGCLDKALAAANAAKRLDDRLDEMQLATPRNDADDSRVWSEFAGMLLAQHITRLDEEALSAAVAAKRLNEKNTDAWVCIAEAGQRLANGAYILALESCPADNLSELCRLHQSYAEHLREQGKHEAADRHERDAEICAQKAMRDILPPLCGAKPPP